MDVRPVVLEGRHVRLEPLQSKHAGDLAAAGGNESIWRYMPRTRLVDLADAQSYVRDALQAASDGTQVAFTIVERSLGRAIGSTRYLDIRRAHRGLEIGWTWIAPAHQRGPINTECKRLLLTHAFDDLGAMRVQLKTDARNVRSQRAIERIGAIREGVLRSHMLMPDGHVRDTVMYSIVDREWPRIKARFDELERAHEERPSL